MYPIYDIQYYLAVSVYPLDIQKDKHILIILYIYIIYRFPQWWVSQCFLRKQCKTITKQTT